MSDPIHLHVRPRAAIPRACVVCGGASGLEWHPYEFEFATAVGVMALFVGIVHSNGWKVPLPACGRCRRRARWSGLLLPVCAGVGIAASMGVSFFVMGSTIGVLPGLLLVLAPFLAGWSAGYRLRKRQRPRVVCAARDELTIDIPRHGPVSLVHRDPGRVGAQAAFAAA